MATAGISRKPAPTMPEPVVAASHDDVSPEAMKMCSGSIDEPVYATSSTKRRGRPSRTCSSPPYTELTGM